MSDVVVSDTWHRLMRLPKGIICLTIARDEAKRIELRIMGTQEDWARWQRLDKEKLIDQAWFEKTAISSDLTTTEILDLVEAERAEKRAKVVKP